MGIPCSRPPKSTGTAQITLCPIQGPLLLLALLFCKHQLQQLLLHCSSNHCSLGRKEDTAGSSIQKYSGTPHLLVWLKQQLLLLHSYTSVKVLAANTAHFHLGKNNL